MQKNNTKHPVLKVPINISVTKLVLFSTSVESDLRKKVGSNEIEPCVGEAVGAGSDSVLALVATSLTLVFMSPSSRLSNPC